MSDNKELIEKPINIIDSGEYVEPYTFENDRESVLFDAYLNSMKYIEQQEKAIQDSEERISQLDKKITFQDEYLSDSSAGYRELINAREKIARLKAELKQTKLVTEAYRQKLSEQVDPIELIKFMMKGEYSYSNDEAVLEQFKKERE
jgi:hypothetical protein